MWQQVQKELAIEWQHTYTARWSNTDMIIYQTGNGTSFVQGNYDLEDTILVWYIIQHAATSHLN